MNASKTFIHKKYCKHYNQVFNRAKDSYVCEDCKETMNTSKTNQSHPSNDGALGAGTDKDCRDKRGETCTKLTREQLDKVNKFVDKEVEERCIEAHKEGRASAIKEVLEIIDERLDRKGLITWNYWITEFRAKLEKELGGTKK
jgi:hypothetical protein